MKTRLFVCCVLLVAAAIMVSSVAIASENASFGQKVKNFWGKLWRYPARLTEETSDVVVGTTKNTTNIISHTAKNTSDVMTGKLGKTGALIADPVKDAATTVGEAAKGIVEAPIKSAK
ncbi:MAG: hypothetical protein ABIJ27_03575 [Candidatus Omnitrophota bacterium]